MGKLAGVWLTLLLPFPEPAESDYILFNTHKGLTLCQALTVLALYES